MPPSSLQGSIHGVPREAMPPIELSEQQLQMIGPLTGWQKLVAYGSLAFVLLWTGWLAFMVWMLVFPGGG